MEADLYSRQLVLIWIVLVLLVAALPAGLLPYRIAAQTASGDDEEAITSLVAAMEGAVQRQDRDAYLSHVDLSDPVFAREQAYWVDDWKRIETRDGFGMSVSTIRVEGDQATAALEIAWTQPDSTPRSARFPARFVRGTDGAWRYAGEAWVTVETEHFRVHAFPRMGQAAQKLATALPALYCHVTTGLDYQPSSMIEIKLYDTPDNMGATIALSLPPIHGWNEPGQSLKMLARPDAMPSPATLAHELTHFVMFDMAGTTFGQYPWWLVEGVAQYMASDYWDAKQSVDTVQQVRDLSAAGELVDWSAISDFDMTPVVLWSYVYPQGYAFVVYVTEAFGPDARNAWLRDMAIEMNLDAASQAALRIPFEELDRGFRAWLAR
jgi:ketosteroid isomerase-like protein